MTAAKDKGLTHLVQRRFPKELFHDNFHQLH